MDAQVINLTFASEQPSHRQLINLSKKRKCQIIKKNHSRNQWRSQSLIKRVRKYGAPEYFFLIIIKAIFTKNIKNK